MTAKELRAKRRAAGITADDVRKITRHSSGRFSEIERGVVEAKPEELQRIGDAVGQIISNRAQVARIAAESGLSLVGVRV